MPETLLLTLSVTVDDLPSALRQVMSGDMEIPLAELPGLADITFTVAG